MRHVSRLAFSLSAVLMLGACAPPVSVVSPGAVTGPGAASSVQEIPISTSSQGARDHFVIGQRLLDAGRTREANEHFRKAVEQDPTFAYAYLELAGSSASAQEFKENLDLAAKNIQGKSEGERMLLDISRTFMDNSVQKRLELQQALVRAYPSSARAWLDLGFTQGGLKQHAAGRESFQKALALDPNMFAAHSALRASYMLQESQDLALAKKHAELAIASAPDEAKGHEFLGDVYRATNQLEDASKAYSSALEKDPGLAVANLKKGHINSFLGNQAEARAAYDAAIASSKEADRVTYGVYRAFVNVHAGDIPAALKELETVAQSVETSGIPEKQIIGSKIFALSNAATIALHHDMAAEAEKIIDQLKVALKAEAATVNDANFTRRQDAEIAYWEAVLATRKGDYATALQKGEEHRRLLESDGNPRRLEGYHALRGFIELRQGNFQPAVEHYRQANEASEYVKYHLALALQGAGKAEEAKKLFQEVANYNFNSVEFALIRKDAQKRAAEM